MKKIRLGRTELMVGASSFVCAAYTETIEAGGGQTAAGGL